MAVVTWNPSDVYSATLSGGNLTATAGGWPGAARATQFRAAGKYYFEVTITTMTQYVAVGFSTSTPGLENNPGSLMGMIDYYTATHQIKREGAESVTPSWSVAVVGDVIGCGIDLNTGLTEFFKNGVKSTTAVAAAALGSYAPKLYLYQTGDVSTGNFGATPFYAGLPAGYEPWEQPDPFPRLIRSPITSPRPVHFIGL